MSKSFEIVLVDDSFIDRTIVSRMVARSFPEAETRIFISGHELIQFLMSELDSAVQHAPRILLLDIYMPDLSGFDIINQLNENQNLIANTYIYMLSSTIDDRDIEECSNQPLVRKLLNKPFQPKSLKEELLELGLINA